MLYQFNALHYSYLPAFPYLEASSDLNGMKEESQDMHRMSLSEKVGAGR